MKKKVKKKKVKKKKVKKKGIKRKNCSKLLTLHDRLYTNVGDVLKTTA